MWGQDELSERALSLAHGKLEVFLGHLAWDQRMPRREKVSQPGVQMSKVEEIPRESV